MKTKHAKHRTVAWAFALIIGWLASGFPAGGAGLYYWYNIGPQPINTIDALHTNYNIIERDSGRVSALAVDPANSNHWLIGAAQGGIWQTTDAGNNWSPRT